MDAAQNQQVLFSFEDKKAIEENWFPIHDRVMGGVSSGAIVGEGTCAVFAGEVSLENNGGFASVRSKPHEWELDGYKAIRLRVQGDGKVYKLCLKTDPRFDGIIYQHRFETKKDEWQTVELLIQDFVPTFRGRQVRDARPLMANEIQTAGLMISDKQAGPFRLIIDWIAAVREPASKPETE